MHANPTPDPRFDTPMETAKRLQPTISLGNTRYPISRVTAIPFQSTESPTDSLTHSPAVSLIACHKVSYEADKVKPAMEFFKLAGRYNHAIRLGFEKNLDYDVVNYALESPNKRHTMLAARKFEAKNSLEHAVRLYQNCGEIKRALELCFKAVPPMFDRYDRKSASARSVTVLAISLVMFVRASVC